MFGGLQLAGRLFSRPMLAPMTAESPGLRFKGCLGKTLAGLPGHDFIAALGDLIKAGCAPIESQADGIENGCLACAGRTGNGEDAIGCESGVGKVNFPFAGE